MLQIHPDAQDRRGRLVLAPWATSVFGHRGREPERLGQEGPPGPSGPSAGLRLGAAQAFRCKLGLKRTPPANELNPPNLPFGGRSLNGFGIRTLARPSQSRKNMEKSWLGEFLHLRLRNIHPY